MTTATTPDSEEFARVLKLVEAAAKSQVSLLQLREKNLNARVLYALTARCAQILRNSNTQLLVNDRADIASAAGAAGVHLTTRSIGAAVVRKTFAEDFLIGVSTHSLAEACAARDEQATFAVFGPTFSTISKELYGDPVGPGRLREAVAAVGAFPLLALGGVTLENAGECFRAGAVGIAGISLFQDPSALGEVVARLREIYSEVT